jgi:rfaE bifunctional protein nucleotidyltransferase chain/domain
MPSKVLSLDKLITIRRQLGTEGKIVVLTNGYFDVLHVGHVRYLAQARALGDCLVVGLNCDATARRLKGEKRPLVIQEERAEVLAGLQSVDYVVIFEEDTAEALVAQIKPDVYAKGGDYEAKDLPEAKIVATYGGKVSLLPFQEGRSTTSLVEVIVKRYCGTEHPKQ